MSKKGKLPTEPYKGVRDFYPPEQALLNYILATWKSVAERFGYVEYHASLLESAELYKAKGSRNEEIISEQTYSFTDKGDREVVLRPEMTPTVARMVAAKRREFGYPLRLYSTPNLFRYERPQRGRLREHWQLNVDLFGSKSAWADAELISVAHALLSAFGASERDFTIRLGSRAFLDALVEEKGLSENQATVLRSALDRKDKVPAEEFHATLEPLGITPSDLAPDRVPPDVAEVLQHLEHLGIGNAAFDPSIVRGFDYYTGVVFEVFDTHEQNNRALFGGGRYDNLTQLFDDEPLPGIGFGMGDVTVRDFLEVRGLLPEYLPPTRVYLAVAAEEYVGAAQVLAEGLRTHGVNAAVDFGEKKLGDQIKTASKHHIPWLIVVGQNELESGTFTVRDLTTGHEEHRTREELASFFLNL